MILKEADGTVVEFQGNALIEQFTGHYGLLEQYVHQTAGLFLFLSSLMGIAVILLRCGAYRVGWPSIMAGLFSTGLIGLGEFAEHFFEVGGGFRLFYSPSGHDFFHYLHMIGAPVALFFLYIGIKEYIVSGTREAEFMQVKKILMILAASFLLAGILAAQAEAPWDEKIEGSFIIITILPTIVIALTLLNVTKKAVGEYGLMMISVSMMISAIAVSATLLSFTILIGRQADIWGLASLYIASHVAQDVLHAVTGTLILGFGIIIVATSKECCAP